MKPPTLASEYVRRGKSVQGWHVPPFGRVVNVLEEIVKLMVSARGGKARGAR